MAPNKKMQRTGRPAADLVVRCRKIKNEPEKMNLSENENFLREIKNENRNPDECLRAAIEKDPNYNEGIKCLRKRSE
jgi:hypothetical protein